MISTWFECIILEEGLGFTVGLITVIIAGTWLLLFCRREINSDSG
jgi:hypothetical protein